MAAQHFIMFYKNGTGTFIITEPRPWARENRHFFPEFDFVESHPTTKFIEEWLMKHKGFEKVLSTNQVVLIQNLNLNIDL